MDDYDYMVMVGCLFDLDMNAEAVVFCRFDPAGLVTTPPTEHDDAPVPDRVSGGVWELNVAPCIHVTAVENIDALMGA